MNKIKILLSLSSRELSRAKKMGRLEVKGCNLKHVVKIGLTEKTTLEQSSVGREGVGCTDIQKRCFLNTQRTWPMQEMSTLSSCSSGRDRDKELQHTCQNLNVNGAENHHLNMQRIGF